MNFWWVNHKQTFKQEFEGGYIWSPKRNKDGSFNQTYENLTSVSSGDLIFSFAGAQIKAIGVVEDEHVVATVPHEFGSVGEQWEKEGYLVKVNWTKLNSPFRPKDKINDFLDLLPVKYSPIKDDGNGNQGCYLASISTELSSSILGFIQQQNKDIPSLLEELKLETKENFEEKKIINDNIPETEKEQLVKARRGQGTYRNRVREIEKECRITGISDLRFLIASHIKPWRDSNNQEKLDGNNGLLLSPHLDKLFDKGWISFSDNGDVLVSTEKIKAVMRSWGITANNVGTFNSKQRVYLKYHRNHIFKNSQYHTNYDHDEMATDFSEESLKIKNI